MCSQCGKIFSCKVTLQRHMTRHADVRQYSCAICEKYFKTQDDLKQHENVHRDKVPYKCISCSKLYQSRKTFLHHNCKGQKIPVVRIHSLRTLQTCETGTPNVILVKKERTSSNLKLNVLSEVPSSPTALPNLPNLV